MSKNPQPPEEKDRLFQEAMRHITPLKASSRHTPPPKKSALPTKLSHSFKRPEKFPLSLENLGIKAPIAPEATVLYGEHRINARHLRQFKQGKFPIEATLDLHGYTIENALQAIADFIKNAKENQFQDLLIITGKGRPNNTRPTIKTAVYYALQEIKDVLAFSSAQAKDGGTGSLYVLLKRERE